MQENWNMGNETGSSRLAEQPGKQTKATMPGPFRPGTTGTTPIASHGPQQTQGATSLMLMKLRSNAFLPRHSPVHPGSSILVMDRPGPG